MYLPKVFPNVILTLDHVFTFPRKSIVTSKMKVVFIGDIRGREAWIDMVQENMDANKFVFFGNNLDPFSCRLMASDADRSNFFDLQEFALSPKNIYRQFNINGVFRLSL